MVKEICLALIGFIVSIPLIIINGITGEDVWGAVMGGREVFDC